MSINTRFAMDTWGVTFQEMVMGSTTTYLLAKQMANLLKLYLKDSAVIRQIGCCSVNDRGMFNFYIKFDYAPDAYVAQKQISRACLELNGLHFQVHSRDTHSQHSIETFSYQ